MKAYLVTTGVLFGLMAVIHVWRVIDEWPRQSSPAPLFVLGMAALIVVPAALSLWAWWLLRGVLIGSSNRKTERSGI
jgi:hypothetical protein